MSNELKRGSIVVYENNYYFFQPWGTSCRLYEYVSDIGVDSRIVHNISRYSVNRPSNPLWAVFWAVVGTNDRSSTVVLTIMNEQPQKWLAIDLICAIR